MDIFNDKNIAFIEIDDITSDGKLKPYVTNGKKTMVMGQGDFCSFCSIAKPAFVQLSDMVGHKYTFATIKMDGEFTEREAGKYIKKWCEDYKGVPVYCIFGADGKYIKTHSKGRDLDSLLKSLEE